MMTRSIWTLALFLLVLHSHAFAEELTVRDPHVRALDRELLDALQQGAQSSPTLKTLLDRLETSDVVVYLMFDRSMPDHMAGRVSRMTAVPPTFSAAALRAFAIKLDLRRSTREPSRFGGGSGSKSRIWFLSREWSSYLKGAT